MKTRILSLILAAMLIFSMTACGNKEPEVANEPLAKEPVAAETVEESGTKTIPLTPEYVVVDNEDLKLWITSIEQQPLSDTDYSYVIHYSLENKSRDYSVKISVPCGDLYLGSYQVNFACSGDITMPMKASDNGEIVALVFADDKSTSTEGSEYISDLTDLFTLNGKLTVDQVVKKEKVINRYSRNFYSLSLEGYHFTNDGNGYSYEDSLQGTWKSDYNGVVSTYSFNHGYFSGENSKGSSVDGTYTIDHNLREVNVEFKENGTSYEMNIPFELAPEGIVLHNTKDNSVWEKVESN